MPNALALPILCLAAFVSVQTQAKPMEYICYSPYRDGQAPGTGAEPTEAQIAEDLRILAPFVKGIRTYTAQGVHAHIPRLAREAGLEVYLGAWIGKDDNGNRAQVEALIQLARSGNPAIKGLIVGNEVLLRQDVTKARLVEFIQQVRAANTGIPVSTADIYQRIRDNSADLDPVMDFVVAHVHPYWEHQTIGNAARHVVTGWKVVKEKYPGKQVIIGETGFPSGGNQMGGAVPSIENQARFAVELTLLARQEGMRFMLFTSFDEQWKTAEGAVGGAWGIWNSNRSEKPAVAQVRGLPVVVLTPDRKVRLRPAQDGLGRGLDALGRLRAASGAAAGAASARALPVWTVSRP